MLPTSFSPNPALQSLRPAALPVRHIVFQTDCGYCRCPSVKCSGFIKSRKCPTEYTDYLNILKAEREGKKFRSRGVFQTNKLVEQYLSTDSLYMGWTRAWDFKKSICYCTLGFYFVSSVRDVLLNNIKGFSSYLTENTVLLLQDQMRDNLQKITAVSWEDHKNSGSWQKFFSLFSKALGHTDPPTGFLSWG